jgi:hypothetical protein
MSGFECWVVYDNSEEEIVVFEPPENFRWHHLRTAIASHLSGMPFYFADVVS